MYLNVKMTILGALTAVVMTAQAPQKNYKDGEFEAYSQASKDFGAKDFAKAVADLDAWKKKYPESDYRGDREVIYINSYMGAKQWGKALEQASEVMAKGFDAAFGPFKEAPGQMLQVLYNATLAVPYVPNPTADDMAKGEKVARQLMSFDRRPDGVSDADWAKLKSDVQGPAKAALLYLAILPGNQAMTKQPRDCAAAESAYSKALGDYPDSATISFNLATASSCLKKNAIAVYEFQRAAVLDPTLGGTKDAKEVVKLADSAYVKVHGSDEGLAQLKQQVKQSPMPPAGFAIKTESQLLEEKEAEFEKSHPQLAMWMKIKAALADANGAQYFEGQLKNSAVPQLRGTLVAAKPACRPKELLVAVPLPDAKQPLEAEIVLKLDKPLGGKPEPGEELRWEGVPTAFAASPFLLTMDTDVAKVEGIKSTPCAAGGPARKK